MKRIAFLAGLLGCVAYAASDTEPWEAVNTQKEFKKPVQFDREAFFTSIDGGASRLDSLYTPLLSVDLFDAGSGVINGTVQIGTAKIGLFDAGSGMVNGDLAITGTATIATDKVTVLDAGSGMVNGNLVVTGLESLNLLDAGAANVANQLTVGGGIKSADVWLPTARPSDGGTTAVPAIQFGTSLLSANAATIVFSPAYSAIPQCVCSSTNATAAACDASATSTTQTVLKGTNAADNVNWICIGAK